MCHHGQDRVARWKVIAEEDPEHDAEPDGETMEPPTPTTDD